MRSPAYHTIERLLALGLLILLLPGLFVVAVLVFVAHGRPILFVQQRAGIGGAPFALLKFCTMHDDARESSHEDRVTTVGRVLRMYGLDELPQLINIVRGEMSFVGPRPTLTEQVARYGDVELRRLTIRPGITGWAQVHGRNAISWERRIELDLWYLENRDLWLDLRILWKTPWVVWSRRGVYGEAGVNPDFRPSRAPARKAA